MIKQFRIIVLLALVALSVPASAAKEPEMKPVYMFGFAASFTDSVACQTAVQRMDSAWVDAHGFLVDRALYSLQLQLYMEQQEHLPNAVSTVYFSTSERKMQRLRAKLQRKYLAAQNLIFHEVPADKFRFKPEEYRPVNVYEEVTPQAAKAATDKNKKQKKEKKK